MHILLILKNLLSNETTGTEKFTIYNAIFENPNYIDLTGQIRKKNSQLMVPNTELSTQAKELKDCPI